MVSLGAKARIGLFLALLALPILQHRFPLLPRDPLLGYEKPVERVPLRLATWWGGQFQEAFEPWFARHLPVREHLVRSDNQLGLSLFGQAPNGGTPLVMGRGGTIFEKAYIDEYNRPRRVSGRRIKRIAADLQRLDRLLARRGVRLITVIAPSKAEIYPELLPARHVLAGRERRQSTYQLLVPRLEASGIALVDGHRLFLQERARSATPLFSRGGTHWNHYAGALVAERLLAELERARPGRFVQIAVRGSRSDRTVWTTDDDLGALLNIWWPRPWPGPQTHPVFERRAEGRVPARLLFAGDSFTLTCMDFLTEEGLMDPGDSIYYFNSRIRHPGGGTTPLDGARFDLSREIEGIDAVVFVSSEYFLHEQGFGFVTAGIGSLQGKRKPGPGGRAHGKRRSGALPKKEGHSSNEDSTNNALSEKSKS